MKNIQKGFTLIELMNVVAIIGIMAAIAIPAYQDYTIRSQVSEGLTLAASAKAAVAESFSNSGEAPADRETAGMTATAADTSGNYVTSVDVENGTITVTYGNEAAKGQVVSFWANSTLDTMTLVRGLNYYLPGDIAVKAAYRASDDFSVRRDALSREYRYHILDGNARSPFSRRIALFVPKMLDIQPMNEACQLIQGEHDFVSFASSLDDNRSTLRNVYEAGIEKKGDYTVFRIVANSFLPHQVRSTEVF